MVMSLNSNTQIINNVRKQIRILEFPQNHQNISHSYNLHHYTLHS